MSEKIKFKKHKRNKLFLSNKDYNKNDFIKSFHINIISDSEITVEGCSGVIEYNNNYIKLNLQKGTVSITGCELDVFSFEDKDITVRGKIHSLEFN